jgi:hypothetical protein
VALAKAARPTGKRPTNIKQTRVPFNFFAFFVVSWFVVPSYAAALSAPWRRGIMPVAPRPKGGRAMDSD